MIVQAMKGCRPLTDKEVARVAEHFLGRSRDRALFLLGVKTGFRISASATSPAPTASSPGSPSAAGT